MATGDSNNSSGAKPLDKLPDAQVFSRDPVDYTAETLAETIARLRPIVERQRKARKDAAEIVLLAAAIKTKNAKPKKPSKSKQQQPSINPMEETL
jgi:hypothetical protein